MKKITIIFFASILINFYSFSQTSFTKLASGDVVNDNVDSRSASWIDYNNDGIMDLFVGNIGTNLLYKNDVNHNLTKITTGSIVSTNNTAYGPAWGDYDNDGDLDLFIANGSYKENNLFYENKGDGTFTQITTGIIVNDTAKRYSQNASWADYDNDGDLDLFVGNWNYLYKDKGNFLYRNNGDKTFTKVMNGAIVDDKGGASFGGFWGDYDNDGDLDLYVPNVAGQKDFFYINNGNGSFNKSTTIEFVKDDNSSLAGLWGDYDNDGDQDLFIVRDNGYKNELYINNGYGAFTKDIKSLIATSPENSGDAAWVDYDNDGDQDLFLTNGGGSIGNVLYNNEGGGAFSKITQGEIVTDEENSRSGIWADYDNDGDQDLFVANVANNSLYINNGNSNKWINIKLKGVYSNSFGIGAKVRIKSNGKWQLNEIGLERGRGSQSSINAEFGLGNASVIDTIFIQWPSGLKQLIKNVAINQFLTIIEDASVAAPSTVKATAISDSKIEITWSDNSINEKAFIVERSVGDNLHFLKIDTVAAETKNYLNVGLLSGTKYFYRVIGYNQYKSSGYSNEAFATTLASTKVPFTEINASLPGNNFGSSVWGDYDIDGDLDLMIAGASYTKIFKNTSGIFTAINSSIPALNRCNADWGDYDNDGDLDIALNGFIYPNNFTKIYKNTNGVFTDINANIIGLYEGSVDWGDYDNDGDLDLLITGGDDNYDEHTKIYKNTNGTFTDINANLSGVWYSKAKWGDYDNDGDLDVIITGNGSSSYSIIHIYKNTNGVFSYVDIGLMGVNGGALALGDYDSDGDMDILICGASYSNVITKIYKNTNGEFSDINAPIIGYYGGSAKWGDYDNDGDLDVLVTGDSSRTYDSYQTPTKIYTNVNGQFEDSKIELQGVIYGDASWGDYDNDGDLDIVLIGSSGSSTFAKIYRNDIILKNTPPSAPTNLSAKYSNGTIKLSWTKGSDNKTTTNALTTNIYLSTTPKGNDKVSSMSNNNNGFRKVVASGNAYTNNTISINNLAKGIYYWGAQTIDNSFSASAFSSVDSFAVNMPPTILSFTPTADIVGASVKITGTNFYGVVSVKFNGVSSIYSTTNSGELIAHIPTGATTGKIKIVTASDSVISTNNFTVTLPVPSITSFTPTSGLVGSTVTITGTNFTGATSVKFNGVAAVYSVVSGSQITATVPSTATTGKLTVTTSSGTATSATDFTVTLPAPTITSFTPSSGILGNTVTITGTNFTGATSVKFNGVAAVYSVVSSSQITATVPSTASTGKITATTASGTATSATDFTVTLPTPTITSFTPSSGGSTVTITGTNFTGANSVKFNGVAAVYSVVSGSQITATVPSTATTGKLTVTTSSGTATSATDFTVTLPTPTITSFTPSSGVVGSTVTITGTNFTGATSAKFNGVAAIYSVVSGSQITATVPSTATTGKLTVTTSSGTATSATDFTVTLPAPTITSFTPSSGILGSTVTITGTNFTGATSVKFNGVAAVYSVVSSLQITATVPSAATTGKLAVTTSSGTATSTTDFTVTLPAPTITSFTPSSGVVGGTVTITGTNFTGASSVKFNGVAAVYSVVSSLQITATVPSTAATGKLAVTTSSGTATSTTDFTVTLPAPTITSFTPSSGVVGSTVTITGTNFTGATSVKFNGVAAVYSVVSSSQITATVPSTAATGKLAVTTSSGTATSTTNFTVTLPTPIITSFTPSSGSVGGTVTITGTNFTGASSVKFNGVSALYNVVNSSQIIATVPSNATTGKVAVTTANGTVISTGDFMVITPISIPKVQFFNPLQSLPGKSVVISGLNFVSISSVKFNGVEADFKVVSSTYISATVPLNAVTGKITVTNTTGTGTSTNNFIILEKINAPGNLTTQSAFNSIILHWSDSSNNESGFVIEKYINNDIKFSVIGKVGAGITKYIDSVDHNKTEQYRVYAYNSSNKSEYSNVASGNALMITSMEDQLETGVKVFPNPSKDKFSIEVKTWGKCDLLVTDILGNKIYEEKEIFVEGELINLDLTKQRSGVYFLKISHKKDSEVMRLFKE